MALRWLERAIVRNVVVAGSLTAGLLAGFWRVLNGSATFFLRDLLTTHIPAFTLFERLRYSTINPAWSQGAPWAGNPNLLVFYPTIHQAGFVSVHILLHLAIGFVGMTAFARRALGVSRDGALLTGILFSGSGYVLSSASFLNAATTIAWVPWLLFASDARAIQRLWLRIVVCTAVVVLLVLGGEPTLAIIALSLCVVRLGILDRKALASFAASLALAAALLAPLGVLVWKTGHDSARAVTGYTFDEAMRASLHPARLIEIVMPFIFGRPDRIVQGAWWGFTVSRNAPPYIYSLSWSALALLLILASLRTIGDSRSWVMVALTGLVFSCGGYLPGAEIGYRLLPHVWRYPIKFMFLTVIAGSVLAGKVLDAALAPKQRKRTSRSIRNLFVAAAAFCAVGGGYCLARPAAFASLLIERWWDQSWRNHASVVVEPLVLDAGWHLLMLSGLVGLCFIVLRRQGAWRSTAILLLIVAEIASSAVPLFPTVDTTALARPSPFVQSAAQLGLIYERAGKDLDAVRRGLNGWYPSDETRWMAIAQERQAWATTGSMYGVRYAFNHDPDGSYPERVDYVADLLDHRSWPERLKWLRAAGVQGVITYDPSRLGDGYACVAKEAQYGVPAFLCALREPLPEIRRSSHVVAVNDRLAAAVGIESSACDPVDCTVIEGRVSTTDSNDMNAQANVISDTGDGIQVATNGSVSGVLFIARPFRRGATATLNGQPVTMIPANICFTAIPVPAGAARVSLAW
jgi:hypothetical protein